MVNTYWEPDIPNDLREIVEPILSRWGDLIPTWVQDFSVRYDSEASATARTIVNHRGRWAIFVFTPSWLGTTSKERENALVHELIHINLEPMNCNVMRVLNDVLEKGTPTYSLAETLFVDGMEASVEDLARALGRLKLREE